MVDIATRPGDQSEARWKSRYLEALDAHERLERDAGLRVGELGALISRLSRALPANDLSPLGRSLGKLGEALKNRPLDPGMSREVRDAHARILDVIEGQDRERAALMNALGEAADRLQTLATSGELKRRLKRFRATLKRREPSLPSVLVAELHASMLGTADRPEVERIPDRTGDLAGPRLDPPLARSAPTVLPDRPGRDSAASAPVVDWQAVRTVLVSLISRVELPDQFRERAAALVAGLESELTADRLLGTLVSMRELFDAAFAAMHGEFRGFLDSVDRRLDILLAGLGQAREDGDATRALERGMADSMQAGLAAIRTEAAAASELNELKHSIDSHLESLVRSVQEFNGAGDSLAKAREARLEAMAHRLRELESESCDARGQLEAQRRLALTDALTGLPNRKAMDERLDEEIALAWRHHTLLTLAIADLDHFKRANDNYGHQAGDRTLALFAGILRKRLRQSDFCARYGGEEFVLMLPGTSCETAVGVLDQVREFVASCGFSYKGTPVPLMVSIGVTELGTDDDAERMLERADRALYAAKGSGRNRVLQG